MIKRWLVTLFICVITFAAFGVYKFLEVKTTIDNQAAQPEYFETVEASTAVSVTYMPTVKALGVVVAPKQVTLRNELSGYISAVNFSSGATVDAGQVIIQLDISEQQANLTSAQAQEKLAQIVYERNRDLRKTNAVNQESVDRSLSELNVLRANIEAINSVIKRRTISAPFSGVIGIHQFEPGQYLADNTEITTLVGHSETMWIDFSLPQFYGELANSTDIRARLVRSDNANQDPFFTATIIAGNSVITTQARSRLYRAEVINQNLGLLHNTALEIEVPVGTPNDLLSVPAQAVRSNTAGQYIFTLEPEPGNAAYRARAVPITIKAEKNGFALFSSELSVGQLIATAGSFKLSEGMLVHVSTRPESGSNKL